MEPPRWNIITPSQYEWERRGLDFIRTGLPDHDPYRAWANFEFQTEARQGEERLRHAYGEGGFLVLPVRPSRMRRCEDKLQQRFRLQRVSFDDLLFDALHEEAKDLEVDWSVIEQADGMDGSSQDWQNLLHLVGRVARKIVSDLLNRDKHLLLVHPGLLARYDQMAVLETLRDK